MVISRLDEMEVHCIMFEFRILVGVESNLLELGSLDDHIEFLHLVEKSSREGDPRRDLERLVLDLFDENGFPWDGDSDESVLDNELRRVSLNQYFEVFHWEIWATWDDGELGVLEKSLSRGVQLFSNLNVLFGKGLYHLSIDENVHSALCKISQIDSIHKSTGCTGPTILYGHRCSQGQRYGPDILCILYMSLIHLFLGRN